MSLEIRKTSNWWYGVFVVDGKKQVFNLEVPIKGVRPCEDMPEGDAAFQRSKIKAEAEYDAKKCEIESKRSAERDLKKLVELKTGQAPTFAKLANLPALWEAIPRRRDPSPRYAEQCKSILEAFQAFMQEHRPKATDFIEVTPELARAFMDKRTADGASSKTWNDTLKLLRATFKHLHPSLSEASNPFNRLVTKTVETMFRKPFTPDELKAVLEAAKEDPFIRPLVVTGICTAMRRGDCCLLQWEDVDLKKWFITVKTSKTGETVDIPIFPLLHDELAAAKRKAGHSEYCFPEQAAMYLENPDGITWRVKKVLSTAFTEKFSDELPELPSDETLQKGLLYLAGLPDSEKTQRMRAVFEAYMGGKPNLEAAEAAGVSKGSVSGYLNEIESAIGCRVVRGRLDERSVTARLKTDKHVLHAKREGGTRRASIRDFHSFRVTWVTLALTAGIPLGLVQRVTGHKTVDVVLKHYFHPGREDFKRTLEAAMPRLFTEPSAKALPPASVPVKEAQVAYGEPATPAAMIRAAIASLEKQTAQNWKVKRDEALQSLRDAAAWIEGRILHEKQAAFAQR